jgi:putative NADH-flavin reductase
MKIALIGATGRIGSCIREEALATLDEDMRTTVVMVGVRLLHVEVAAIPVWDTVYVFTV